MSPPPQKILLAHPSLRRHDIFEITFWSANCSPDRRPLYFPYWMLGPSLTPVLRKKIRDVGSDVGDFFGSVKLDLTSAIFVQRLIRDRFYYRRISPNLGSDVADPTLWWKKSQLRSREKSELWIPSCWSTRIRPPDLLSTGCYGFLAGTPLKWQIPPVKRFWKSSPYSWFFEKRKSLKFWNFEKYKILFGNKF